jgi:hypothetical protein
VPRSTLLVLSIQGAKPTLAHTRGFERELDRYYALRDFFENGI